MTTKEHPSKHDREIAAIRTLIVTGMKMLNRNQQQINRNQQQINELVAAQTRTEASLKAFLDALRGGGNGHTRRKVE